MPEDRRPLGDGDQNKSFDDFLKSEYNNIAQAHFDTSKSISEFFKAYIAIVSLPVTAAVIFLKPDELRKSGLWDFLLTQAFIPLVLVGGVAFLGLLVLGYVINLRCDALLYARTVNGIRKYFYEASDLDVEAEQRFRMLPRRTEAPRYFEGRYFLFVVLAFAAVGTGYWSAGLYFFYRANAYPVTASFWALVIVAPMLHIALYAWIVRYRDRRYLRSRILGVDIDGVLNEHRQHFCAMLADRTGKTLHPEEIIRIPVHEIPGCGVDVQDERAVFNWPLYWSHMPVMPGSADSVQRIRNELGYNIWLFTYRPWPHPEWYKPEATEEYRWFWKGASLWSYYVFSRPVRHLERWLGEWRVPESLGFRPIRSVTKRWLRNQGFRYDKLIVERGNVDTRDPLFLTRNRFVVSARKEIRAFVEDDPTKARRLADLCEIVFLMDQPYNRDEDNLPKNVVRVKEWNEIYQYLRRKL
jgi:uncharacterized HAD superfamily protein